MNTAVACARCGAPVFNEDRFCGTCGAPRTPPPGSPGVAPSGGDHASKLLAQLKASTAGEYEIRGEIGRGGMAAVYLAYDLRLNRKVAIKVMLPELTYHEGMEERFKREARTAAKLDHPNIVVIHSVREVGELMFFVMKFIDGAPLDAVIRTHGPLALPTARGLLFQLCNALQYAHDEGVVHRDVKPANVLIDTRGGVQVTDFGIAKATESPTLTRTGTAIGTPAYMSPEQCLGQAQSPASDQYSVGVLAYELVAGRPPFSGAAVEIQWSHVRETPLPLIEARPDCPPELSAAIMRMLAKNPADRWSSLREVIPLISRGVADAEAVRPALADLVRVSTVVPPPNFAITPASPVPQRFEPRVEPRAIAVIPADGTLEVGGTLQLEAQWSDGGTLGKRASDVSWTCSDADVVAVTTAGLATGLQPGRASITAGLDNATAQCELKVEPARVVSLEVTPWFSRVEVGATERMISVARDARGAQVHAVAEWSSSDPRILSADDDGVVTGHALGEVTVAATIEGLTATARVAVVPDTVAAVRLEPGVLTLEQRKTARLQAVVTNQRGLRLKDRPVSWSSSDPAIARVDSSGVVTGVAEGETTVAVTVEGQGAIARVEIVQPSVASVSITPPDAGAIVGDTIAFTAAATDALGFPIERRAASWRTSDPALATVSQQGEVSARRPGEVTISVEIGGVTASSTLRVSRPPIARIDLGTPDRQVRVGKRVRLRPVAHDTRGDTVKLSGHEWSSSDPSIASVTSDGTVSAHAAGTAIIRVRADECESEVTVRVSAKPAPSPRRRPLVFAGVALALGAIGVVTFMRRGERPQTDDSPSSETNAPPPVDSASTSKAAPTNPVVTSATPAQTKPADSTAKSPSTAAPSPAPPSRDTTVSALRVDPDSPILIEVGERSKLVATAVNKTGERLAGTRVQLRASDARIASVSSTGEILGVSPGQTSITARSGGQSRVVSVQVRDAAATRVDATIVRDSLQVGESSSASARSYDRRGSLLSRTPVWRSSNSAVATVDENGSVRAAGVGRAIVIATVGSAADSVDVTVHAPTVARTNAVPALTPAPRPQNQPTVAKPPSREPDSAAPSLVRPPSEADARAIGDSVTRLLERRQIARITRFGAGDPAKARADLGRFLDRNHPSARLAGDPVVAMMRGGIARITLPVRLEWRTIADRQNRVLTIECDVEATSGGWSIREIGLPGGFTP